MTATAASHCHPLRPGGKLGARMSAPRSCTARSAARAPPRRNGGHHEKVRSLAPAACRRRRDARRCGPARVICRPRRAHSRRPKPGIRRHRADGAAADRIRFRFLPRVLNRGCRDELDAAPRRLEDRGAAGGNAGRDIGPGVRRYGSAPVGRTGRGELQDHDIEPGGADLFRPGTAPDVCVQSRRGTTRLSQGAEARSGVRHVLLGRGARARPQHQSADAGRGRGARLCRGTKGAGAHRQGKPARAGADCGGRGALRGEPKGGPQAAGRRVCRGHGPSRRGIPGGQRNRGSLRRVRHGSQPMELLAARRARAEPAKRRHRAHIGARARQGSEPSRRDSLLHSRRGGVGPAGTRRAPCRPAARRPPRRRPPRAHAEPHLLSARPVSRRAFGQQAAGAVDERYLAATAAPMAVYRLGYYPHNVHFVIASAQMAGDGPVVIAAAEKLRGLIPDEIARGIAMTQPVKAAPYFAHAQFSPPDTILALPDPGDAIPYVKAMWHYARGIADAASGDFAAADAEANAIEALERTADFSLLKTAGVPAQDVLKLARALVQGRVAQARGDTKTAIARFEEAAALQDRLPYMEPPYWYYPVRQSLGAALVQAGRLDEAEDQFRRALKRAPNNGWSYYGLSELYRARGDADAARKAEAELAKTWIGDRVLLQLPKL